MKSILAAWYRRDKASQGFSGWTDWSHGPTDASASPLLSPTRDAEALTMSREMCTSGGGLHLGVTKSFPMMGVLKKPGCRNSLSPYHVFVSGSLRDVGTQGSRPAGTVRYRVAR